MSIFSGYVDFEQHFPEGKPKSDIRKLQCTTNPIYQERSIEAIPEGDTPMTRPIPAVAFLIITAALCLIQATGAITLYVAAADSSPEEKTYADYICDGTGDQIEIQEGINDLPAEGGEVMLLAGHFQCDDNVKPRSGTVLSGKGIGITALNFSRGTIFLRDIRDVQIRDFITTGSGAVWIYNSNAVSVRNITATTDTSAHGAFWIYAHSAVVEDIEFVNCTALNCSRHGFVNNGEGSPKLVKNLRYINCTSINSGLFERFNSWSTGFDLAENNDLEDCLVTGCLAEGSWESGFHIEDKPVKKSVLIENCISQNNGQRENVDFGAGYLISGDVTLKNCTSENNKRGYYIATAGKPGHPVIIDCMDRGSDQSYVLKETADILILNSSSIDAQNMGISVSGSKNITLSNFTLINAANENIICQSLGSPLYKSEDGHYEHQSVEGMYSCGINVETSENVTFSGTITGKEVNETGVSRPVVVRGGFTIVIGTIMTYFTYRLIKNIKP